MKPVKALYPLAVWVMRIGLLLFAYDKYFKNFSKFHLNEIQFYISSVFLVAALIIAINGFIYKTTITILSAIAIAGISIYYIIEKLDTGLDSNMIINIIITSLALFFLSNPNGK